MQPERGSAANAIPAYSLKVKRNCSITPRAVFLLLGVTAIVSFGIGAVFAWYGLWLVLPFAGIEMLALTAAFVVNGRHAGDYERFACEGNRLLVEIRDGMRVERHEFNPHWVRMLVKKTRRETRIALAAHGRELEVGRHLDDAGRALLARELDGQIALMRAPASRGIAG